MDGGGIDVWVGTDRKRQVDAILCVIDLMKRDSEIKVFIGCTQAEKEAIYETQNQTAYMKALLIRRE